MIEQTWTPPSLPQPLQPKVSKRSNIGYVALVVSCCWLCVCLLNVLLLAGGLFNSATSHISIGIAVYTLFSLMFLLPGCLVFAAITAFRHLFYRPPVVQQPIISRNAKKR